MFDVLVVGELNVDLILNNLQKIPEVGKEVFADEMTLTLGSSSAIFASNISSLGAKTTFIGRIGKDLFGEVVLKGLQERRVDTSDIITDEICGTGATVVVNSGEDRAMITYPGAMQRLTAADITREDLRKARHLHFSSYFLQSGMRPGLKGLFSRAKEEGLTTSFDMQWDPSEKWDISIEELLPLVDVFLPNETELLHLTGEGDLTGAIMKIKSFVHVLAVKRGSKGSVVFYEDELFELPAFINREVVDAIGAGDSFNAGFIYRYIKGHALSECQRFGNLTGALNTTSSGGTAAFADYEKMRTIAAKKFGEAI